MLKALIRTAKDIWPEVMFAASRFGSGVIKKRKLPDPKQPSRLPEKQQAADIHQSTSGCVNSLIENRILDEPLHAPSRLLQKHR
jgi:hypothetical protein